jgi:hypothetical protein
VQSTFLPNPNSFPLDQDGLPVDTRLHSKAHPAKHRPRFEKSIVWGLLIGTALVAASCGKVGPALPPEVLIPQPVSDLSSQQIGNEVKLAWTAPALNTNGSTAAIQRFEVFRMVQSGSEPLLAAKEMAKQFKGARIMAIDSVNLAAFTEHGKVTFVDKFPGLDSTTLSDARLCYAIRTMNKKRQDAGFSNIIVRQFLTVPPPVSHIDFRAEETALILTWDAPTSSIPAAGYNVYRSEQSKVRPQAPLNEKPIEGTRFEDKTFQFGTTYFYTVRAVVRSRTVTAESADSPEFSFKPVDVFPPKPPTGLTSVFAAGKMNLLWDANQETDFDGYNAYRSDDGVTFKKINEALLKSPTFRDEKVERGKKYFYRVTAIDVSGNESAPSSIVSGIAEGPS